METILYQVLVDSAIVATIAVVVFWGLRTYLSKYLAAKADNLATKEDIKEITCLQEEVKAKFSQLLEKQRAEAQLRLAVADRRFQAHQQAHTLWLKLFHSVHSKEVGDMVMKCQDWWEQNSLYLDQEARLAFKLAYGAAFHHRDLLRVAPRDEETRKHLQENWAQLTAAGPIIEAAVSLPSLGKTEWKRPGEPLPTAEGGPAGE